MPRYYPKLCSYFLKTPSVKADRAELAIFLLPHRLSGIATWQ